MVPVRMTRATVPRTPTLRESSALTVQTDSDDVSRMWIKIQQSASQIGSLQETVKRLQEELNRLRMRKGGQDIAVAVSPCPYG